MKERPQAYWEVYVEPSFFHSFVHESRTVNSGKTVQEMFSLEFWQTALNGCNELGAVLCTKECCQWLANGSPISMYKHGLHDNYVDKVAIYVLLGWASAVARCYGCTAPQSTSDTVSCRLQCSIVSNQISFTWDKLLASHCWRNGSHFCFNLSTVIRNCAEKLALKV